MPNLGIVKHAGDARVVEKYARVAICILNLRQDLTESPEQNCHSYSNRSLGKDGHEESVRWLEHQYDKEGTATLIELFRTFAPVVKILFNGPDIPFVTKYTGHDDHFHLKLRG